MLRRKGIPTETTVHAKALRHKNVSLLQGVMGPGLYFKDLILAVKKLNGSKAGAETSAWGG